MNLLTLPRFLVGQRDAILQVASARGALWLGLLFVLSAGFAREYDQEDLLHEPWYLALPLVASLASSLLLFLLLYAAIANRSSPRPPVADAYKRFLTLYWMTAPLAWLYAIPFERFLSPGDSVRANLWMLGIVSLWRVSLIVRCVSVLFGAKALPVFGVVMLFADSLALVILHFTPVPIFNVMGGIALSESESVILGTSLFVKLLGSVTWPVWLIWAVVAIVSTKPAWTPARFSADRAQAVSRSAWGLAAASLLVWGIVLPFTQPDQQLRRQVDSKLSLGKLSDAIQTMSAHQREDFPPHWNPQPWPAYNKNEPPLVDVLEVVVQQSPATWVREVYQKKLEQQIDQGPYMTSHFWISLEDDELEKYVAALIAMPYTHEALRENANGIRYVIQDTQVPLERRQRLHHLLDTVGIKIPEPSVPEASGDDASEQELPLGQGEKSTP